MMLIWKFFFWKIGEKKVVEYYFYVLKSNILCFNNCREFVVKKGYFKKYDIILKLMVIKGLIYWVFVL